MSDSFSDWTTKLAEAYSVLHRIPCKRKFTDLELERPLAEVRAANDYLYADRAIKRDQLARHEGRADQDMSPRGGSLKAGS